MPIVLERALVQHFGHQPDRASLSFLGADPVQILRFRAGPGRISLVTLGMSAAAMTPADAAVTSTDGPRAELVLTLHSDQRWADVWRRLAVLAAAPQIESVVYAAGMTVDLGEPMVPGSSCSGVMVTASELPVPAAAGDTSVFAVVPATANELAFSRVRGSDELLLRWAAAGTDLEDLGRGSVALDA